MELTLDKIEEFQKYLYKEEKSKSTIEKYTRDILAFFSFLEERLLSKEELIEYKQFLMSRYKISSINSMLISIHVFLDFIGQSQIKIKLLKQQKAIFLDKEKELTKNEYQRLLKVAKLKRNERLYLLIQTICATGIRVSEHQYLTVEAIKKGKAIIHNKGKAREIFFPDQLRKSLLIYCQKQHIVSGTIFITKHGNPMNRSNIWANMKSLCYEANVSAGKVYPHNLRHLFAFTYYNIEKDLVRLADILGHSSIETTRIYTMTSSFECRKTLSKMKLIV